MPKEDQYRKLLAALEEWEVLQGDPSYEQAICQLVEYLSISYPENNYRCAFGDYALCAGSYGILTREEMERCRVQMKGKGFRLKKPKLWVRGLAATNFYGREYVCVTLPGLVLWELSGITAEAAQDICREVSRTLDFELRVLTK